MLFSSNFRHASGLWLTPFLICTCFWFSTLWTPTEQIGSAPEHGDSPNSSSCREDLKNFTTHEGKCAIASHSAVCQSDAGFIPYLAFEYCTFTETVTPTVLLAFWLIILLMGFATVADAFFSPCLVSLACTLHMSESIAGVTLLAFGNGAPDFFSALAAITTSDPDAPDEGLGFGFLLGAGLLVNTLTAGLVMIIKPFQMCRRPFIKDTIFYVTGVSWAAAILIRRRMTYTDSVGFVVLYVVYATVTSLSGTLYKRMQSTRRRGGLLPRALHKVIDRLNVVGLNSCLRHLCPTPKSEESWLEDQEAKPSSAAVTTLVDEGSPHPSPALANQTNEHRINSQISSQSSILKGGSTGKLQNRVDQSPASSNQSIKKPSIEITPAAVTDVTKSRGATRDFSDFKDSLSSAYRRPSMFGTHLMPPVDRYRQRPSFVGSCVQGAGRQRWNSIVGGVPNFGQEHYRRRRPSGMGFEPSYMVRWIIESNELRRARKSISTDSGNELKLDALRSSQTSRRTSRLGSAMASAIHILSPIPSSPSEGDHIETSGKKITIDLVPKDVEDSDFPTGSTEMSDSTNLSDEGEIREKGWLERWASQGMWHHLGYYLIPIDLESWSENSILIRVMQVVRAPIFLLFRLTIPVVLEEMKEESVKMLVDVESLPPADEGNETVDHMETVIEEDGQSSKQESKEINEMAQEEDAEILDFEALHGWCKPLNVWHCLIVPMLWPMLLTNDGKLIGFSRIGGSPVPIFVPFLCAGFVVAIVVHCTSTWNKPPRYYHRPFFATLGFITSVIWIYALANEVVNTLETLGIVWEISEAILGLSVMAVAGSVGDLMANTMLARNGYPRIAYSACLGSPLFNLLLGGGISYTIKLGRTTDGVAELSFTLTQALLFSCLLFVVICNMVVGIVCRFRFHRAYGIFLICLYVTFVTIAILIEVDVIVSPKNWRLATGTE
ncbi:unnamed protein product [Calicophoron daubneyi]|uniref:Sodium/calcium exchanger membrane region domain-containing protein n=1 Tax=Calicophoron daubneyi TaxID=300641 RepID=A0AAV2TT37_CALDB